MADPVEPKAPDPAKVDAIENKIESVGDALDNLKDKEPDQWQAGMTKLEGQLTALADQIKALSEKPSAQSAELNTSLDQLRQEMAGMREAITQLQTPEPPKSELEPKAEGSEDPPKTPTPPTPPKEPKAPKTPPPQKEASSGSERKAKVWL
jgi:hypothetical protein